MGIGIDVVSVSSLRKSLSSGVEKVFLPVELEQGKSEESLAGVFAAKEAFFKAMGRKGSWLDVWVEKEPGGRPVLHSHLLMPGQRAEVSISHAGGIAVAVVLVGGPEDENPA